MGRTLNVYRFKVELEDIDGHGEVWRTIDMQGDQTLHHLHRAIQSAFDWDDDHLYSFYLSGRHWDKSSEYVGPNHPQDRFSVIIGRSRHRKTHETSLDSIGLTPGRAIAYLFDYGDEWRHNAVLLDVHEQDPGVSYPRVVERHGEAPKQYPDWDEAEEEAPPVDKTDILKELGSLAPLAEKICAVCEIGREPRTLDELREQCSMALKLAEAVTPDRRHLYLFDAAADQRLQFWLMTLPEILAEKGLFEEAVRLCAAWAELMQAEHFLSERAAALAQAGRAQEAREQLSCNLERFPKDSETLSRAGGIYRLLKDYADAESCYRRFLDVIDDQRDYERGVARLISLLKEAGKTADAQVLEGEQIKRRVAAPGTVERAAPKVGRNDPCPCGSGKKHKKCCLGGA